MNSTDTTAELFERIRFRGNPIAHPDAVVTCGRARFTVLTPRLIRLEWSASAQHEDRGTYAFPTRYAPEPSPFEVRVEDDATEIDTGSLTLRYQPDDPFNAHNTSISAERGFTSSPWHNAIFRNNLIVGSQRYAMETEGSLADLDYNGWSRVKTAAELGVNKTTLWRKMKKYDISTP